MNTLNIGFLNVCSLTRKVREVQQLMASRGIHSLGLAEPWLNGDNSDGEVRVSHFDIHRRDRPESQGGGVAIYCHNSIRSIRRRDLEVPEIELMWLEVRLKANTKLIGCYYRSPSELSSHWDVLESSLETA